MKKLLSMFLGVFLLLVMSCATTPPNTSASDIDKEIADGKIPTIEYKILLNEDLFKFKFNEAGDPVLTAEIAKELKDLGVVFPADKAAVKKGLNLYAVTKNGELQKQQLIFRIKEDLVKPSKSKITLKSRGDNFENLDFKTVEKVAYEFDAAASGKPTTDRNKIVHKYNTSLDFGYDSSKEFAVKDGKLDFQDAWKWLDKKYYWVHHMLRQNYPAIVDATFPGVAYTYSFVGEPADTDPKYKDLEFAFDYWIMKKDGK
ncbi:MAG TPA: hypothetical protein DCY00_04085, partial [Actinobacteria bacterium]|nr:hypothetical protein [Actinomycetota bacterium]